MIRAGQIVLFKFPQTDQTAGKIRPALLVQSVIGPHDDWLVCMISSQLRHEVSGMDDIIRETDDDFSTTGLKEESLVRTMRLAVVGVEVFYGAIGEVSESRLTRVRSRIAEWIMGRTQRS